MTQWSVVGEGRRGECDIVVCCGRGEERRGECDTVVHCGKGEERRV